MATSGRSRQAGLSQARGFADANPLLSTRPARPYEDISPRPSTPSGTNKRSGWEQRWPREEHARVVASPLRRAVETALSY
jgi:hypothetical protein